MNRVFVASFVGRVLVAAVALGGTPASTQRSPANPDFMVSMAETGKPGGDLIAVQRAEPRTLNPVMAVDAPSRDVLRRMHAGLLHINRETQQVEPALARSWKAAPDGSRFTLTLRRGIQFSDGHPFDADDVVFSL